MLHENTYTKKYITLLIHENTYTTIIAANTRIHDTRNFDTRVKLYLLLLLALSSTVFLIGELREVLIQPPSALRKHIAFLTWGGIVLARATAKWRTTIQRVSRGLSGDERSSLNIRYSRFWNFIKSYPKYLLKHFFWILFFHHLGDP